MLDQHNDHILFESPDSARRGFMTVRFDYQSKVSPPCLSAGLSVRRPIAWSSSSSAVVRAKEASGPSLH
jgi:hypothetical protein